MKALVVLSLTIGCSGIGTDEDQSSSGGAGPTTGSGLPWTGSGSTGSAVPPPAKGACMDYDEALFPATFAPYQTTCTTTEPYACSDELGCETSGAITNITTGLRVSACIRPEAGDNPKKWPVPESRAGIFLRAIGVEAVGELHVGMGSDSEGNHGWYRQEGEDGPPEWVTAESLSSDPPRRRGVTLCFDGEELHDYLWYSETTRIETVDTVPAGVARIELGFEVHAPPDTDMLGRISNVDADTFPLGSDGCDTFDPPSCN